MRKEIGSEFWNIPTTHKKNSLFSNVTWFTSGRAALRAILQDIKKNSGLDTIKAALPSFLCESMIEPFEKENIEISFYPVSVVDGSFKCEALEVLDCNVILLIDYFGYGATFLNFSRDGKIVIRDTTHSLFAKEYTDADYYYGSLRKWAGFIGAGFGIKKGGALPETKLLDPGFVSLRKEAMHSKAMYISGKTDDKEYMSMFHKAELLLDECQIAFCGSSDVYSADHLDVESLRSIRRDNASFLTEKLNSLCVFKEVKDGDCPLCVPIICEKRDRLRDYLISKEVYCPVHWPKPSKISNDCSNVLYEKELSLVCDQRYSKNDMARIVEEIENFYRGCTK